MQQRMSFLFWAGVLVLFSVCFCHGVTRNEDEELREGELGFTNTWAVELDTEDEDVARDIAKRYGYEYGGRIGSLPRHFMFVRREKNDKALLKGLQQDESSGESNKDYKRVLEKHPRVKWAERQAVLQREKQIDKH